MKKLFIEDLAVKGKRVMVRVDYNVPLDDKGTITNDKRITETLPTINYLSGKGAKTILMSHLGRPDGQRKMEFSLKAVAEDLKKKLTVPVSFVEDCVGPMADKAVGAMKEGEVLLLENLRFYKEEEANDPVFAKKLAANADLYVNDAFGTAHRAHASTEGVTKYVSQSAAGYLMKKELDYLGKALEHPEHPFAAIIGGAKISGKIDVIINLLNLVDMLLIGGGMMFTFFKAMGLEIGKSLVEEDRVALAKKILDEAKTRGKKLLLPVDCVCGFDLTNDTAQKIVSRDAIPKDMKGLDIGPETIKLFSQELSVAKTIVWNGPLGVFEVDAFAKGTKAIAEILASCTDKGALTIIGGGDSASAVKKAGVSKRVSHVSTGGGASLEYLEGKVLPGVAALTNK